MHARTLGPLESGRLTNMPKAVLVHGAWADGSSWNAVSTTLQGNGFIVLTPPNLLHGIAGDAADISSFLAQRTAGPVVLGGHSYGGVVITNAAAGASQRWGTVSCVPVSSPRSTDVASTHRAAQADASDASDAVHAVDAGNAGDAATAADAHDGGDAVADADAKDGEQAPDDSDAPGGAPRQHCPPRRRSRRCQHCPPRRRSRRCQHCPPRRRSQQSPCSE